MSAHTPIFFPEPADFRTWGMGAGAHLDRPTAESAHRRTATIPGASC